MSKAPAVSKTVTIRVDEQEYARMEALRDRERFPSQSDFIREAIRRMLREERRSRVREESKALAAQQLESRDARQWIEAAAEDLADRWDRADRGAI
jgi:Arc/MetJ-type ribon-helix-helix transcriptional regulator